MAICANVLEDCRIVKAAKGEGRWHENYFRMRERRQKSSVKNVSVVLFAGQGAGI